MNIVVHEMGHALGLLHPHQTDPCDELNPPFKSCPTPYPKLIIQH